MKHFYKLAFYNLFKFPRVLKFSFTHIFTPLGTDEERGIIKWNAQFKSKDSENQKPKDETDTYDLPLCMGLLRR